MLTGVSSPAALKVGEDFWRGCRRGAGSHVAGVKPNARRRHGTASRDRLPDDPLPMGRRDRAVQPGGRAAHAFGTDRRRRAGVGRPCHAGAPGPDAAAWLAGLPLDARTRPVPAARPDRGTVPDRPTWDRGAALLRRDRWVFRQRRRR